MITNTNCSRSVKLAADHVAIKLSGVGLALCFLAVSGETGYSAAPPVDTSIPVGTKVLVSATAKQDYRILEIRAPWSGATLGVILFEDAADKEDSAEVRNHFGGPR